MRKYDNILVPYDGTMSTEYTIKVACDIARWNESQVLVLAPFYPDAVRPEYEEIIEGVRSMSRRENIKMDVVFHGGRPSDAIIDMAYKKNSDLIVIGKTAMNRLERIIIGSFTGRIIGHANSDVIIVPEYAPLRWRKLMLCTDLSKYSAAAVDHAIAYAGLHGGVVNAVTVVDLNEEFYAQSPYGADKIIARSIEKLESITKRTDIDKVKISTFIREGNRVQKLLEMKEEIGADIIFMGSHERIWFGSLMMGSISRDVAMDVDCPVFIIKP